MRLFILLLLVGHFTIAQNQKSPTEFTESLRLQMLNPDAKSLASIFHNSLNYGHSNGLVENKSQVTEVLLTGANDFTSLQFDNVKIEEAGKNAIVRLDFKGTLIDKNKKEVNLNLKVLMVLLKQKGNWVLLARQGFRLPS